MKCKPGKKGGRTKILSSRKSNSHTLNAICLPHDNATALSLKREVIQNTLFKKKKSKMIANVYFLLQG